MLLERSVSDLNSLRLAHYSHPHDTFLAAGAPWFFTMFGRDSIIAARMLLPINTAIAGGTLRALAGRQGTETDHTTAVQPGKDPARGAPDRPGHGRRRPGPPPAAGVLRHH